MRRSKTSQDSTIEYEAAKARVTFSPAQPRQGLPEFQVRFHFPAGAVFDSFLHFHTEQSEYLFCEKGQIRVTVGQLVRLVGPEDGMITIDPWVAHRWETVGAEAIVWERSDPHPETKELFFRNIFGAVNDHNGAPPFLQMFKFFADYDNYPTGPQAFVQYWQQPIKLVVDSIGRVASLMGYKSAYPEYTPSHLNTAPI